MARTGRFRSRRRTRRTRKTAWPPPCLPWTCGRQECLPHRLVAWPLVLLLLFFGNQLAVQAGEALAADRDDMTTNLDGEQVVQFLVIANQHRHAGEQTECPPATQPI